MINMKSLKIFLSILMLQVSMQAHSDNDALADLIKGILGAKLLEGIAQEFGGTENANQQSYSNSSNRIRNSNRAYKKSECKYEGIGGYSCYSGNDFFQGSAKVENGFVYPGMMTTEGIFVKNTLYSHQKKSKNNQGSLGYRHYLTGQKYCKNGKTQQAIKWFKESRKQGYEWADRAIDSAYSKCREGTVRALSRDKVCSNGVYATAYVDNECPCITNRWSNNNAKVDPNSKAITSENITIKAPKYVENAAVVPVTVVFGDRVESGEKIKLYVNGELAIQVNPKKGSYVDKVSTRVRLQKKSNHIKAKIIRKNGVIETKTSNKIYADNPVSIPSSSDSNKRHKLKEKNGNMKVLIRNKMGSGKHIWKIKITSSSGDVFVKFSPLLSKDPYINIRGNLENAKIVKKIYGRCNKDYSNWSSEPSCLLVQEAWYKSLNQDRKVAQEKDLNKLKIDYINKIASKVKNQWRYYGAQDEWGCDVHILQDENGNVKGHNLKSCYIGDINKEGSFKNAVKRAIFKSSPLPLAPDGVAFDKHIVFRFKVDNAKDNYQVSNLNKVINQKNETISYKKFCKKLGKVYRNKHFGLAKSLANDGINQNNACAQYYFGLMHHKGDGVNLNYSKAIKWYEKSYKQGFSRAGHALSDMYGNGEYVTYDYRKSLDYAISAIMETTLQIL
jgi:TPR repeat protein/predicted secreted protein